MDSPGTQLLRFCEEASGSILFVSPFIKTSALQRLLNVLSSEVIDIQCVTRWHPEEVLAGVSDLEVFDIIESRGGKLFIHPCLHAKYFRSGKKCLLGSANITLKGLGWSTPANLELLVKKDSDSLQEFETQLFSTAIQADFKLKSELEDAVKNLAQEGVKYIADEGYNDDKDAISAPEAWLPLCTRPELLFKIYASENTEKIVGWTLEAGQRDIRALGIPHGFSGSLFKSWVAASLQQAPLIQIIYEHSKDPISSVTGRNLVAESLGKDYLVYSPDDHWKTLRDWLIFFLPNIYRVRTGTDMLQRGTVIGNIRGWNG